MTTLSNPKPNDTPVKVTAHNYVRAESDFQMRGYIEKFNCFGKFHHSRKPYEDYCTMSNILGNAWWADRNRTNRIPGAS